MNKPVDFWTNTLAKLGLKRRVKRGKRCELKHRAMRLEQLQSREMLTTDLAAASFASNGEDWIVTYDVTDEAVSAFDIGIYRSSDGVTADSLLQTERVSDTADLAVGTGHVVEITPDFTDEDEDYYLIVRLDDADENAESSETNNEAVFSGGAFLNRGETHGYDESTGALTSEVDALGRRTGYEWDEDGQLVQTILPAADEAGPTIDDSFSSGYVETGTWLDGGSYRYASGGGGANVAIWQFDGLDADKCYDVFLSWSADGANASDAPVTFYDGTSSTGTVLDTVAIDQTAAPDSDSWAGGAWQYAGTYSLSGSTLSVTLSDAVTTGYAVADSVMVLERSSLRNVYSEDGLLVQSIDEAGQTTSYGYNMQDRQTHTCTQEADTTGTVVDDGDADFATAGTWTTDTSRGEEGDVRYAASGAGGAAATWTFDDLDPNQRYVVLVTWTADATNNATDAPYSVYDGTTGGTLLDTIDVDQQVRPTILGLLDANWESLGTYTPSGDTLTIRLTNNADGRVIADSVRVVEASALSETIYDTAGNVIGTVDTLGNITEYEYDNDGRQTKSYAPYPDLDAAVQKDDGDSGVSLYQTTTVPDSDSFDGDVWRFRRLVLLREPHRVLFD